MIVMRTILKFCEAKLKDCIKSLVIGRLVSLIEIKDIIGGRRVLIPLVPYRQSSFLRELSLQSIL